MAYTKEEKAFTKFHRFFPEHSVLLVDTYDTLAAVAKIIEKDLHPTAIRLDSGNLLELSLRARQNSCRILRIPKRVRCYLSDSDLAAQTDKPAIQTTPGFDRDNQYSSGARKPASSRLCRALQPKRSHSADIKLPRQKARSRVTRPAARRPVNLRFGGGHKNLFRARINYGAARPQNDAN